MISPIVEIVGDFPPFRRKTYSTQVTTTRGYLQLRCPYVHPDGRQCDGYIKELEWFSSWGPYALLSEKDEITHLGWFTDRASGGYILLHCSKGSKWGTSHQDEIRLDLSGIPDVMKMQDNDLPRNVQLQLLKYGFKEGRLEEY